ncbi:hypothetical protein [Rickettsiella grylli]|uniref:Viral A-type inclusion protein n=1 Tax=Rickettsiella grylli TaxID=59196 RepID=A8PKF6_9COXI|nr:hypothetical protein [Rickettsiella grylli]EDP46038.1 putative viral A-type inclusion protein [Rickettsiella grylli]OJA00843.1 hypothetical protein BEV13_02175 [Rickettsiella grylli]
MSNLALHSNPSIIFSAYSSLDLSKDIILPLTENIHDYDPIFKENYQILLNYLPDVLKQDALVIQQFTSTLNSICNKVLEIKNKTFIIRNELGTIRDGLAQSIRDTQSKLDELSAEKESLIGQKQVLEKQIKAKKAEIDGYRIAFWLFNWIIAIILESIKPFDAALNEIKRELAAKQREIENLNDNEKRSQQLLNQSVDLFNVNLQLLTQCDTIKGNIENIQSSLKRLDVESHFLKAKLTTLEKDWSNLMEIVTQHPR